MERFQRLEQHGFTVLILPQNWSFRYPPETLHNDLIVEALERVSKIPPEDQSSRPAGYDHQLARGVMEALNEVYPHPLTLIELKYQFFEEPADEELSTVLNALRGDGYIDGVRVLSRRQKLNPMERVTLTSEGRRHLADEMAKRSRAQQSVSDSSKFILAELLAEFRERDLTTSDLQETYKGISPKELKDRCSTAGIGAVDFDLAMKDLIDGDLIDTGPKEHYKNDPSSGVLFVGFFTSKNEYSFLTEKGYREAVQLDSSNRNRSPLPHGNMTIHGDQYINLGLAGAIGPNSNGTINYQQQWASIEREVDLNVLIGELEQLRKHLQQSASSSSDYQRLAFLSEAEEHARKSNGGKAMEILSRVGKGALGVAKDIGTDIAAKVIAKSMGLEP